MKTELIATQFEIKHGGAFKFTEPVFHELPVGKAGEFCKFLANAIGSKVRWTRPDYKGQDVTRLNGHYTETNTLIYQMF